MVGSEQEEKVWLLDFETFVTEKLDERVDILDGQRRDEIDQFFRLDVVFHGSVLARTQIRFPVENSAKSFIEMQIFVLVQSEVPIFCAFFFLGGLD